MPFDPIARYYDQDDGRIDEDIPTILGFAQKTGGPVLDLGVGTARLALPVAEAGYDVTGIDSAATMLAIAKQKVEMANLAGRVTLIEGEFTDFDLGQQFGLAYCGFNGFLHLVRTDDQLAALRCWRRHLRPDGILVIDIHNPSMEQLAAADGNLSLSEQWIDPETGHTVYKLESAAVQLDEQIYHIHRFYDEVDGEGVVRRSSVHWPTRILFRRELALLLTHSGYRGLQFFGDHDYFPWEPGSPRIVAVARP